MSEVDIAKRIKLNAELEAERLIAAAKKNAAGRLESARKQIAEDSEKAITQARNSTAHESELSALEQKAEARKNLLAQKYKAINDIFTDVRKKLAETPNEKAIAALTKRYMKKGDTVERVNGGIIINNSTYELRLTIDELLADLREQIEIDIANMLF